MSDNKPSKVFISGPMTGYDDYNRKAFIAMEMSLKELGYSVFNPAWLKFDENWDHDSIMKIDISALEQCDAIVMLKGWGQSKGSKMEYSFAVKNRKIVMEESDIYGKIGEEM